MPDQYKHKDYITAYKQYYIGEKKRFAKYTGVDFPDFLFYMLKRILNKINIWSLYYGRQEIDLVYCWLFTRRKTPKTRSIIILIMIL